MSAGGVVGSGDSPILVYIEKGERFVTPDVARAILQRDRAAKRAAHIRAAHRKNRKGKA